jgi:hypothetical protein
MAMERNNRNYGVAKAVRWVRIGAVCFGGRVGFEALGEDRLKNGARKRTRTSTTVRPLAPEASASANSAIRARCLKCKADVSLRRVVGFVNEWRQPRVQGVAYVGA